MKNLLIAISLLISSAAYASSSTDLIFYGKVLEKTCDTGINVRNANDVCLIVVQSDDDKSISGLVMDGDSYYQGGKYIRAEDTVMVDLTYTEERTAELKNLFPGLPATSKIYFHDKKRSAGSMGDVINFVRRN
jgi:hypothetical protein